MEALRADRKRDRRSGTQAASPRGRVLAPRLLPAKFGELLAELSHIRARTRLGVIDFIPEGEGPLAWEAVSAAASFDELHGVGVRCASLAHLVALKRMAGRPRDREDLAAFEQAYGELPGLPPVG